MYAIVTRPRIGLWVSQVKEHGMARRKRAKVEDETVDETTVNPLSVLLWSAASLAGVVIVYNAFMNQPPEAVRLAKRGVAMELASQDTSPKGNQNTVILRYDQAIEDVQRELLATGHYKGLVDGVNGQQTRIAIQAYQRDNNLALTDDVTPQLLEHIRFTRKISDAAEFTGSTDSAKPVTRTRVTDVQKALADLGYQPGEITGQLNAATRAALRQFETDKGLRVDGEIDASVIRELSKTTGYEHLAGK